MIALIPLRGGSKSIPLKNIKLIAGKPLCYWTLKSASDSQLFKKIVVSTDSPQIAQIVQSFHLPSVEVLNRPLELAEDTTSTEAVMLHAMQYYSFNTLCLIQATSPLTTKEDFKKAFQIFQEEQADSLVTGVLTKRFFWNLKEKKAINYDPLHRPRRQDFDGLLMENGAFYFTKRSILEQFQCRLGGKISLYLMDDDNAVEIDEPEDWEIIEKLLLKKWELYEKKHLSNF